MSRFERVLGIDYSGASTPQASLPGLRIYLAEGMTPPREVLPPPGRRKYWSRQGVAVWLADRLGEGVPTLVGIDHGFSFPLHYFERHGLKGGWTGFLDDFCHHWPTDQPEVRVDDIRTRRVGSGRFRLGDSRWRRLTELRAGAAKSVFHFDVQGSVAKSTHAGLPWLRWIRQQLGSKVHVWPFDGWAVPAGRSAIAEVYPSLWSRGYPRGRRTPDQHDAYSVARRLQEASLDGSIQGLLHPALNSEERATAQVEGWILGVDGSN